jgi:hypothetical protein
METNAQGNTIERGFDFGGDRYKYDFEECSPARGWAQYDTDQDASYFGVWVHPETRRIFTYCEGDTIMVVCPTEESYHAELAAMAAFYGPPPPAFVVISPDENKITNIYDVRPA